MKSKGFCVSAPVVRPAPMARDTILRPEMLKRVLGASPAEPLLLAAGQLGRSAMKYMTGPLQTLYVRLWVIYATEDDGTVDGVAARSRAELLPVIQSVVTNMRKDWAGTGIEFVFLPERDFEIRKDSRLFRSVAPDGKTLVEFPRKDAAFTQAQADAVNGNWSTSAHRNSVAAERPNTMLWIMGANSGVVRAETSPQSGVFQWIYVPHLSGSFSGSMLDFALMNQYDLASDAVASGNDASRAAHEAGHFLHLDHTHREDPPLHDESAVAPGATVAERLATWKTRIAGWIDANVPAGSSAAKALQAYDFDRGTVTDTPADPGGGILMLANGGNLGDEMKGDGKIAIVTKNAGTVTFAPDRFNVMSYYLGGKPADPMHFSPEQIARMRGALTEGNRRRIVAAQLGDTKEPGVRVAAVWSPSTAAQALTWRKDVATLKERHATHGKNGLRMTAMSAYVVGGQVFYDAFWDMGAKPQPLLLGWAVADAEKEIAARAKAGWGVASVQAYRHPGTDLRYNVIFEQGLPPQTVWLGKNVAQVDVLWKLKMPQDQRLRCLDSAVDDKGQTLYSAVFENGTQVQRPLWGWTLEHLAAEYGKEWAAGRRLRQLSVADTPVGLRYTALFDADTRNQLVYWLHVRERIAEIYDEMWWQGFRLRSLDTIGV